ncbi:MAG: PatB family C-S lyase [Verrucomicrobia bacterium]|nr:PatB family C-S lyase [Verrucomicrobiota bacterium]MCH8511131.1 PatB family C-S lyase [Kiritimatiellia bacterium]
MTYDFTTRMNRKGTGSLKWQKYEDREILPMWVADMDFFSPPEVIDALRDRVDHGVFGYTVPTREAETETLAYLQRRHGLGVDAGELVWLPGLVQGLNLVCRASGKSGDGVMVNTPVYPPFLSAPVFSDRKRITSDLIEKNGRWTFDREGMERAVTPDTRLFILCNPHNPVGRVFSREELEWLLDFCERHDLWICSDEIHCDLIFEDVPHVPMLALGERAARRTIAFYSPSKTYNLPGLACAYAVIPNPELRNAFRKACRGVITEVNCFGYTGCAAAYRHGEPWRQEMLKVLRTNRDLIRETLATRHPKVTMPHMESTYLAWLDFRAYDFEHPAAHFEAHGLGLSNGMDFGAAKGFLRLNFGCPTQVLEEGLDRLGKALPGQ